MDKFLLKISLLYQTCRHPEKRKWWLTVKLTKPWTPEICMECYCVVKRKPIRGEKPKLQMAAVVSLWFCGLLTSWTSLRLVTTQSTFRKFFSHSHFSVFGSKIQSGLKKPWIPGCPLGKQLSHFAAWSHFLLVLVNDFVRGWFAWTLAHWPSKL